MYFDIPTKLISHMKVSQNYWWVQYQIEIDPDDCENYVSFSDYLVLKLDGFLGDI